MAANEAIAEEWPKAEGRRRFTSQKWHGAVAVAAKAVGMMSRRTPGRGESPAAFGGGGALPVGGTGTARGMIAMVVCLVCCG